jgi:uncharacterized OB-fold protein
VLTGLPRPLRDADSEPFWRGCDAGRLRLQRCAGCGAFRWPPGPACPACRSLASVWVDSRGRGAVYSWVVVHVPLAAELADQLPYAVGLIELDEGVRLVSTIEGCDPEAIAAGMRVTARFDDAGEGRRMLTFVPAAGAGT